MTPSGRSQPSSGVCIDRVDRAPFVHRHRPGGPVALHIHRGAAPRATQTFFIVHTPAPGLCLSGPNELMHRRSERPRSDPDWFGRLAYARNPSVDKLRAVRLCRYQQHDSRIISLWYCSGQASLDLWSHPNHRSERAAEMRKVHPRNLGLADHRCTQAAVLSTCTTVGSRGHRVSITLWLEGRRERHAPSESPCLLGTTKLTALVA